MKIKIRAPPYLFVKNLNRKRDDIYENISF